MDIADLVLVLVIVAAAIHGLRLGALVQVLSFVGFVLGLTIGALIVGEVAPSIRSTIVRASVTLSLVIGLAVLCGIAGRVLGTWSNVAIRRHHLGVIDSVAGVAVASVAVLLSAWLVASLVTSTRYTWLSKDIERSDILRTVDEVLPPVPSVFSRVQSFLSSAAFPPVFADLAPPIASPVPVPTSAGAARLAFGPVASTVKIEGVACGEEVEGSGFVVGPGLVVTNAHVVAGESVANVVVGDVPYPSTTVLFNPDLDLAVLRTSAPLGPVLQLDASTVGRGTQGVVIGYPGGGPLEYGPAGVTAAITAQGRDIYNEGLVVRSIYELDATVRPGNSGGPLVGADGQVIGVVFSRSTVNPKVGYALASPPVAAAVATVGDRTAGVSTGACTTG